LEKPFEGSQQFYNPIGKGSLLNGTS
jgi:hypothetical protein